MRDREEHEEARAPAPGVVTRLVTQKKDANRMSVFLDDDFAFGVHKDLVIRFDLHKGRRLEVEEQIAIRRADAVMRAKAGALNYLSYRARTEVEVRRKLERKEFAPDVIDEAIARLYELHYLDDGSYAKRFAASRSRRGYGPQRAEADLRKRGVAQMYISAAVEEAYEVEATLASARRQARKRAGRLGREGDSFKRKQKLSAFLVRRGFSYETARRVVEEVARELWVNET